jgi:cytochrome c5
MKKSVFIAIMGLLAVAQQASAQPTYRDSVGKLFDEKCAVCHGKNAAPGYQAFKQEKEKWLASGQGMRMDSYSLLIGHVGWPETGALMRRLDDGANTKDKKPGNMYRYLGADEAERKANLAIFKEWVGNWTLKRWNEISKEELSGIKVKY